MIRNGIAELHVTWDDILWAAVTIGRPNRHYVFRHGAASVYEALFRWSLVRATVEQKGSAPIRLHRTTASKELDPTEKSAVDYFLGMTFCKLFAARLLGAPLMLHLDVFRKQLNAELNGRSRPDLIGYAPVTGEWHAFECKGRIGPPDATTKKKAKEQATRLISIDGTPCSLHVGAITYFKGDVLNFFWRDPNPQASNAIEVQSVSEEWRYYYGPVIELVRGFKPGALSKPTKELIPVEFADIEIGIHPVILKCLAQETWDRIPQILGAEAGSWSLEGYQSDGLMIRAGATWQDSFE